MMRLFALLFLISGTVAAAEPAAIDPEFARLQAAEAAVRAGRSTRAPIIINNRKAPAQGEGRALAMPHGAPREFPVPPRNDGLPTAGGVQALIAAGMAAPPPKPATGDAAATAAGLDAIADFRRSRGAAR